MQEAIIFNTSVYYATIIYESLLSWLFLCVGFHIIASGAGTLSIDSLVLLFMTGIFFSLILVVIQIHIKKSFVNIHDLDDMKVPL